MSPESEALSLRSRSAMHQLGDFENLLNLSEPQFTYPAKEENYTYCQGLCEGKNEIFLKVLEVLEYCLTQMIYYL